MSGKRCGLISVSEYSDPQFILEYLTGVCHLLAMEPIRLSRFPYLGVGGQGDVSDDPVFRPLRACHEMAERLASALAG